MNIMELIRYDHEKGCFVAKSKAPTYVLSPFDWKKDPRPSIFLQDPRFKATKNAPQTSIANPKPFFPYTDTLKDK